MGELGAQAEGRQGVALTAERERFAVSQCGGAKSSLTYPAAR